MIKRLLSLLLILVTVFSLTVPAYAASTVPAVSDKNGNRYDATDEDQKSYYVSYDKKSGASNSNFVFYITRGTVTSVRVGPDTDYPARDFVGEELSFSYDKDKNVVTVNVAKNAAALNKLSALCNLIAIRFSDYTEAVYVPLYVYPDRSVVDGKFVKGGEDNTVVFFLSDVPDKVYTANGLGKDFAVKNGKLLTEGTDYTVSSVSGGYHITIEASGLNHLNTGSTNCAAFLFEGSSDNMMSLAFPLNFDCHPAPTVTPEKRDWTYGSDASFTVGGDKHNKAVDISFNGSSLTAGQASISSDGKTVTVKSVFLKNLARGDNAFTIVTEDGSVTVTVRVLPPLQAKDGKNSHIKGSDSDLVFTCSTPITGGVKVGTVALKDNEYSLSADGKTLTLKASFLNARGAGNTFTLTAMTASGEVSAQFRVEYLATPQITSVTASGKAVTVKWGAVEGAEAYRLFYVKDGKWVKLKDTTSTSVTLNGTYGKTYTYTVRCINKNGSKYTSAYDKTGKSITLGQLATPQITSVTANGKAVTVKWGAVEGAEGYRLFYVKDGKWVKLKDTTSTSVTLNGTYGKAYTYTVRCISANGKTYTSAYDKTGKSVTLGQLATPQITSVTADGKAVTVKWGAVEGAEAYRLFYVKDGKWVKLKDTTSTSVTLNGTYGKTYTYTVRCVSANGKSYTSSYDKTGVSITLEK